MASIPVGVVSDYGRIMLGQYSNTESADKKADRFIVDLGNRNKSDEVRERAKVGLAKLIESNIPTDLKDKIIDRLFVVLEKGHKSEAYYRSQAALALARIVV